MKLGLDIGNSTLKGALLEDDNQLIANINYPSAVVRIPDSKFLTFSSEEDVYIQVVDSKLDHFTDIVAFGNTAYNLPDYLEFDVTSTSKKANHKLTTSLLFGALAQHVSDGDIEVKLAVTVPIVEAKTLGLMKEYKTLLEGHHTIMVYRESGIGRLHVHISVATVMNEGQAGFLGMLDTSDPVFHQTLMSVYRSLGETSDPIGDLEDFLIVDIGEGTTDLAVFRDKRFNPEYSYSVTRGYGNLLEDAMANAEREGLTIESRKDLQNVLLSTNKRRQKRKAQWLPYVAPTKEAFVELIVDTIMKTYGNRDYFDAIIFIGGGFSALTGYTVEMGVPYIQDDTMFVELKKRLERLHKSADLIFGIPAPYAQGVNERGLVQVLSAQ